MEEITTDDAPPSIGPFSQGIKYDDTVHISGQGPIDPESGEIIDGDIRDETERTLRNVAAVLKAVGASLDDVVATTVYVRDMNDYNAINEEYAKYFSEPYPARSAVEVSDLPVDIGVEIEVKAIV
jgi:2-iminobutanoate/2-iminopropanoate deaminase